MTPLRLGQVTCAVAVVAAAAMVFWPLPEPYRAAPLAAGRYSGAEHQPLRVSRPISGSPFSLATASTTATLTAGSAPALVGVAGRTAYLKSAAGEVTPVGAGEELDGWRVVAVRARSAVVQSGSDRRELRLFTPPPTASPTP